MNWFILKIVARNWINIIFHPHFSGVQNNLQTNYWNSEDMNSFGALPPLDIEPLPSLFPFSPCAGGPYKYVQNIFWNSRLLCVDSTISPINCQFCVVRSPKNAFPLFLIFLLYIILAKTRKAIAWYGRCATIIETCCTETKSWSTTNAVAITKLQSSASVAIIHGPPANIGVADTVSSSKRELQFDELLRKPMQWSASASARFAAVHVSEYEC